MATAIEFNNISKQYRLGVVSGGTVRADFQRWWQMTIRHQEDPFLRVGETNDRSVKGNSEYVWALKDIDFKVEQGDVVGIIGKNGAGKSTLLKILSKVTGPTTGTIRAKGRIGSLLEVGTGFHPEMTGRENIYLNGAILGMSKQEINRKLDEIVDFSGCERYIDTPVKRYSSGMMVRLGFAVAAHLDPEILVVDEVLAVGDAEFQKKAIGKMQDVSKGEGRTVLFVSHNMASIRALCNHGVLLENGGVKLMGDINDVVKEYLSANINTELSCVWNNADTSNLQDVVLSKVEISDVLGKLKTDFSCDEEVIVNIHLDVRKRVPGLYGCFYVVRTMDDSVVLTSDSGDFNNHPLENLKVGHNIVSIKIPKRSIGVGKYRLQLDLASRMNVAGFTVVKSGRICGFEINDYLTSRGNGRQGYFSTLIPWEVR